EDVTWRVSVARIGGLAEVQRKGGSIEELADLTEYRVSDSATEWTVQDLYQGLTPKAFTAERISIFKTSTSIARYMVNRFVKAIEELGRTRSGTNVAKSLLT
ncbi:hypothetical protein BGX27_005885, partial [Mortierella sp. AM989]